MTSQSLIIAALLIPTIGAGLIAMVGRAPNLRESVTLATALALFAAVMTLLPRVLAGELPATGAVEIFAGVEFGFAVEPLGMIFACVASTLWIVNSIYSFGCLRGTKEPRQTSVEVGFAIALAGALGVAFSANLFTLFLL